MWFIGVEVEPETSAPPPKKNPGFAPECFTSRTSGCWYKPVDFAAFSRVMRNKLAADATNIFFS